MKILKSRPHNRVCISCGALNVTYTLCKKCKGYKSFIHPNDYKIVSEFYSYPDLLNLKLNFNIKSVESILAILKGLKVPVGNYTLRYMIFNREKLSNLTYDYIRENFHINTDNPKFKLFYSHLLPGDENKFYSELYSDLRGELKSLLQISKHYKIPYETIYIYSKIIKDNEITY